MHEELTAVEGSEEVKVERREQHKSSPDLTDCLEGVDIANWGIDEMNSMMEKLTVF